MSNYGVTPKGIVTKRLDEIINDLHDDLSEGWGVNTRLNPESYLNVQLTAFSDKLAELWEFGEQIYHSMYPFSAEGASLDNAVQYGGVAREDPRPTYYPTHCECVDGTIIPKNTAIKTSTNPAIQFYAANTAAINRNAFNKAKVRLAMLDSSELYSIALDGELFSYTSGTTATVLEVLNGLARAIKDSAYTVSVDSEKSLLLIDAIDVQSVHALTLGSNLTTESVTGILNFASETNGELVLPNGVITQIVTGVPGLISVINLCPRIAGRLLETDAELRRSYADKIFIRSNRMLESIKSAILRNVQGVISVAGYQNDTNAIDAYGRWPHCVEMVVEGGADYEIALTLWDKKCDGIITFGSTEVVVPGDEGEPVTIRFNRPVYVYVWFQVIITMSRNKPLPPNYVEAIKSIILAKMESVEPGAPIVPQEFIAQMYAEIPGIAHIDTPTFYTTNPALAPGEYVNQEVIITPRERAVTTDTRIEVVLAG